MSWETSFLFYYNDGDCSPKRKGRILSLRLGKNRWLSIRGYGTKGRLWFWTWKHDYGWSTYRRELGRGRWALDLWWFAIVWEDLSV